MYSAFKDPHCGFLRLARRGYIYYNTGVPRILLNINIITVSRTVVYVVILYVVLP